MIVTESKKQKPPKIRNGAQGMQNHVTFRIEERQKKELPFLGKEKCTVRGTPKPQGVTLRSESASDSVLRTCTASQP